MKTQLRPLWKDVLAAIWLGMVIPGIVLNVCVLLRNNMQKQPEMKPEKEVSSRMITLRRTQQNITDMMDINTYLTGVLLAEMPANFEQEALKAQAVAARTYTMKILLSGGKHGDGSLCDDTGCCQGFIDNEMYHSGGGIPESIDRMRQVVADTASYVLTYEGKLIEAVYFSSSGGRTESALAVWGADYPYLQSVESPGENASAYHYRVQTITAEEFQSKLDLPLTGRPEDWFTDVTYTDGGGVDSILIAGTVFTGVRLRNLLDLPSTAFSVAAEGDQITVISRGYGHRVGMSQFGANAMAQSGYTFEQILAHYYPGTVLTMME